MRLGSREVGYPHLLVAALLVAMLVGVGVGAGTSSSTYGAFNAAWDGGSGVRGVAADAGAETEVVYNTTEYDAVDPAPAGSVAFVISPERGYTDAEAARIEAFVRAGGTVVVADDFRPHGNDLLARLGASARIDRTPLRDDRHQYKSGALPVATRVAADPLTRNVTQLSLNHPATVTANESTVLVRSSNFSYLDRDDDGELDDDETLQSHPVVTRERLGAGDVVVVSDPSVFINAMLDRPDNRAFATALVSDRATVVLDFSHAEERPPLQVALRALRDSGALQLLFGVVAAGAVALVARQGRLS
ncbi:DUF4350 domain-containing protein [Haloferax volcanii]|uniref:DUF4350 domain protein n=3 Tax=Haloferax volcanii TaxID=2246 RepID=D4GVA0_HALVD|nr:DUF4350 domain-containing protein [Haloferax volcanii]ADE04395.1 DUF4350 domain protein [Haloferax volcanii DS2]ELY33760.1 hypothetical protein C498_06128 [Haloferax volcanii DS2]MBS8119209.1 DUF4350 domain-containing protein [Haloferax volcanii]MBS8124222.1 DUF4350 domain-containing protein [Haloferax volcanii]MBS8128091.1 DUF4350 domain-containing protein [Haloferax volcanii]